MEKALTEKTLTRLVEKVDHKYYGKYRGIVVDNNDPEKLGRLKVKVPSVLGNDVVTGWAMPCLPYGGIANQGFLAIPEIDAGVWVEFEAGDLEYPVWVGTYWGKPGGESELPKPNQADGSEDSSVQEPPTRKIMKTKQGHTIQLEDKEGEEMVLIVEAVNGEVITMDKNGIKITDGANSHEVALNGSGISVSDGVNSHEVALSGEGISIQDGTNQHSVVLNAQGVKAETQTGATVNLTASGVTVDAGPGIVEVKGSLIKLSSSASLPVIRVTDQGVGNLGAPVVMLPPGNPTVLA
jgi:uncharacterized protein involved in type VI secretion and phage assembly